MYRLTTAMLTLIFFGACTTGQQSPAPELDLFTLPGETMSRSLSSMEISLPWQLANPTTSRANLGKITWTVSLGDTVIKTYEKVVGQEVEAEGQFEGRLNATIPFETSAEAFKSREDNPVRRYFVEAEFEIGHGSNEEIYQADWHDEFFAPKKPGLTVSLEAGRYGRTSMEFVFTVGVDNPNPFKTSVEHVEYKIFIADTEVENGKLAKNQTLNPSSTLQFDVQHILEQKDNPGLTKKLMRLKTIPYRLEGIIRIQNLSLDTVVEGQTDLPR